MPSTNPAPKGIPSGYTAVFPKGFNAWIGPIFGKFDGPPDGPHHFFIDVGETHLNGGNMAHGGFLQAVADVVLGSTVAKTAGSMGSTITLNCDFLAGVKPGTRIEGEATISRRTRSVAFVSGKLYSGDTVFMTASGIWKLSGTPGPAPDAPGEDVAYPQSRQLQSLGTGEHGEHWKPSREVAAPAGLMSQPLGDPFEAWVGPFYVKDGYRTADPEKGELEVAFQIDDRHVNAGGICHGGMFMTFADATHGMVPWRVANTHAVTLSMQSQFLRPGHLGDLVITRPRLIRKTSSIIFVESTFEIEDETVYTATSLWKVIGK